MMKIKGLKLPMIADEIITGKIRWADSGGTYTEDDPNHGKDPDKTFATIDYGISRSVANNGDYLIVLPGHTENITTSTTVDLDIAGLTLLGLGHGTSRPTLTQTVIDIYVDAAAANLKIKNILFMAGVNTGTGTMLNVIGDDCIIDMCEFKNVSASLHTNHMIEASGANTADGMIVKNCRFDTMAATDADTDSAISLAEVQDRVQIIDNYFWGTYDDACIHNVTAKTCTNLTIARNKCYQTQADDHAIEIVSACTGFCTDNVLYASSTVAMLDPGSLICSGNVGSIGVDSAPFPIPGPGHSGIRLAVHASGAMSANHDATDTPDYFTVVGTCACRAVGVVSTNLTSTSNTGTIQLGTSDSTACLIPAATADGTAMQAGDIWFDSTSGSDAGAWPDDGAWVVIDDATIEALVSTKNMTAGVLDVYLEWRPLSANGNVVAT